MGKSKKKERTQNNAIAKPSTLGRSFLSIVAGMFATLLLSFLADQALSSSGFVDPAKPMSDALFLFATAYRTLFGAMGSYLTAAIAPNRPMRHVLIGGFIGLAACLAGVITTWDAGPEFGPNWYPIALFVLALPTAWIGGWLFLKRNHTENRPSPPQINP